MRIGLFGGTFDPIHWGHLRSAEEVREVMSLDRILFIPASSPPHKQSENVTSARGRLEMVRLATTNNPHFAVSTVEIERTGVSYSIDTLRFFVSKNGGRDSYFFILGFDAFREIGTWKDFREIFPLCHFVITSRPEKDHPSLFRQIPIAVRRLFCYDFETRAYHHQSGTDLYFVKLTDIAISSSDIRQRAKEGKSIRYLVPLEVENYIKEHGLYRQLPEAS
jgi:nicotinate-nucleotide adenylyltransferase